MTNSTPARTYDWPRLYLLKLYQDAVERGHIVVEGLAEPQAQSLKMALYRLRRRSDNSNKHIILPEYHLVTCGEFRDGSMAILYNSVPDGTLPTVRDARTGEVLASIAEQRPEPQAVLVLPPTTPMAVPAGFTASDLAVDESDISDFVANLRKKATNHE